MGDTCNMNVRLMLNLCEIRAKLMLHSCKISACRNSVNDLCMCV